MGDASRSPPITATDQGSVQPSSSSQYASSAVGVGGIDHPDLRERRVDRQLSREAGGVGVEDARADAAIREEVVLTLFHAEIQAEDAAMLEQQHEQAQRLQYEHEQSAGAEVINQALGAGSGAAAAVAVAGGNGDGYAPQPARKSDVENIGRNDPCWCGSGKKYKKCHGA